jgi:hypothetical protein
MTRKHIGRLDDTIEERGESLLAKEVQRVLKEQNGPHSTLIKHLMSFTFVMYPSH